MDDKRFFLERLIKEQAEERILVFVRTKVRAERVQAAMARVGIEAGIIHGGRDQAERMEVLDKFRNSTAAVLIATDVSARGIDIPGVRYVVNYDLPDEAENYVHRVGRTGRGMEKGFAISFCATEEKPQLEEIEEFLGKPVTLLSINRDDYQMSLALSEKPKADWKDLIEQAKNELGIGLAQAGKVKQKTKSKKIQKK
jgi:ATP-dependent RNA helicase RhlE